MGTTSHPCARRELARHKVDAGDPCRNGAPSKRPANRIPIPSAPMMPHESTSSRSTALPRIFSNFATPVPRRRVASPVHALVQPFPPKTARRPARKNSTLIPVSRPCHPQALRYPPTRADSIPSESVTAGAHCGDAHFHGEPEVQFAG